MRILIGVSILLAVACLVLIIYIISLKREMKSIQTELMETQKSDYNRQLRVALFDQDLTDMTIQMNHNLDYQKQLKLQTEQIELQMKQSVSDIAHDLRTPLTVIKGNLQLLDKDEQLSSRGKEYLDISIAKTETLRQMVDDFFELSVLESDQTVVELQKINATNLLMQFLLENEAVIRAAKLTPELQLPDQTVFICADEMYFKRMLSNLLNNILKYGKESFSVRLEEEMGSGNQSKKARKWSISFTNKIDSSKEFNVEQMFERSYQGDKSRRSSGAGLGLYIVKLLADKQNAKVSARRDESQLILSMIFDGE